MTEHSGQVGVEVADVVRPEFMIRVRRELTHEAHPVVDGPAAYQVKPEQGSLGDRAGGKGVVGPVGPPPVRGFAVDVARRRQGDEDIAVQQRRHSSSARRTSSVVITPPRSTWGNPLRVALGLVGPSVLGSGVGPARPLRTRSVMTALILRPWSRARDRARASKSGGRSMVVRITASWHHDVDAAAWS